MMVMVYGAILGGIIGGFLGGPPGVVAGAYLGIAGAAAAELIFPDPRSPPGGDSPPPGGDSPPPGPDNCFVSGTPIVTESGLLPIEQITAGLRVKTFDTETKLSAGSAKGPGVPVPLRRSATLRPRSHHFVRALVSSVQA